MIAWLTLEGVTLHTAPIIGDKDGRVVWAARDGQDELQRYTDRRDTWDRYIDYEYSGDRKPASFEDLSRNELCELYEDILENRE
jgi:hypothetical protein